MFKIIKDIPETRKFISPTLLSDDLFNKIYKEYNSSSVTNRNLDIIINIRGEFDNCNRIMLQYIDFRTDPEKTAAIIIEKFPELFDLVTSYSYYVELSQHNNSLLE